MNYGRFLDVMMLSNSWFEDQLRTHPKSMQLRGTAVWMNIRTDALGYAPPRWDGLVLFMKDRGIAPASLADCGMAVRRCTRDGYVDRFTNIATFHSKRAEQQQVELPRLKKIIDDLRIPAYLNPDGTAGFTYGNSQYANKDPVAELEERIYRHKMAALKYDFYAKHVEKEATFHLNTAELATLGLAHDHHDIALVAMAIR